MSLYSWLLVQNYLIEYTSPIKYEENSLMAFLRFGSFGFLSMISYDCYLKIKSKLTKSKNQSGLSKYWLNKVFIKGLYGVTFCASSQYLKELFDKKLEE
jgi:hypothetical protein